MPLFATYGYVSAVLPPAAIFAIFAAADIAGHLAFIFLLTLR